MKFKLEIACDNDAFAAGRNKETARILREVAKKLLDEGNASTKIYDVNGNGVGSFGFIR